MLPPAPARFSTTTLWPMFSESFFATMRAAVSVPPPGAKPTVSVTVRDGKLDCASAPVAASTAQASAAWMVFFMGSPRFGPPQLCRTRERPQ